MYSVTINVYLLLNGSAASLLYVKHSVYYCIMASLSMNWNVVSSLPLALAPRVSGASTGSTFAWRLVPCSPQSWPQSLSHSQHQAQLSPTPSLAPLPHTISYKHQHQADLCRCELWRRSHRPQKWSPPGAWSWWGWWWTGCSVGLGLGSNRCLLTPHSVAAEERGLGNSHTVQVSVALTTGDELWSLQEATNIFPQ